jgi:hypothetical protein
MTSTTTLFAALVLMGISSLSFAGEPAAAAEQNAGAVHAGGLTRAQVRAEFIAARDAGELIVGENGEKANEINPQWYPAHGAPKATLRRADVRQLAVDAQRSGTLDVNDAVHPDVTASPGAR